MDWDDILAKSKALRWLSAISCAVVQENIGYTLPSAPPSANGDRPVTVWAATAAVLLAMEILDGTDPTDEEIISLAKVILRAWGYDI